jgi:hypothetical protein
MPFLYGAAEITVVVVTDEHPAEQDAVIGVDAVGHLRHHSIHAALHHVNSRRRDVGARLMAEVKRQNADGYGHLRLRERLLGGVTYNLMHEAPVPLLMAH